MLFPDSDKRTFSEVLLTDIQEKLENLNLISTKKNGENNLILMRKAIFSIRTMQRKEKKTKGGKV